MKELIMNNRGSASVEAALVTPLYIFLILFFIYVCQVYAVEGVIYEGAIETAEYMAEYAYLADNIDTAEIASYPMVCMKFSEYVDDSDLLEKYVVGGMAGVSFLGSSLPDDEGYIDLKINYIVKVDVPFLGSFKSHHSEHIKQRAYLGITGENAEVEQGEVYVYVTDGGEVYHTSRGCTHLLPRITGTSYEDANRAGYRPCEYCGGGTSGTVYITEEGECFHSSRSCSRLRRSVKRVKLSETSLPACSKCGGGS